MAVTANKRPIMVLYSSSFDLYSHQVRIVLAEKGVTVDIHEVDLNQLPEDLYHINPYGTVPTLFDRELGLFNADIIMEYLEERFPHPPLMPVYPVSRGKSRLTMYQIRQDLYSLAEKIQQEAPDIDKHRKELKDSLIALSSALSSAPYLMSEEFSLIDCYMAPLLWRLPTFKISLSGTNCEHLKAYMMRIFERESFQASLTDKEREMRAASLKGLK